MAALVSASTAAGATRWVDASACPGPGTGTQGNPFCRIQDAICVSASGDTVTVRPGTYPESLRMKPGVVVVSSGGALVTTINANGQPCTETDYCTKRTGNQCSAVLFSSGHTLASVLDGFTVTGGRGTIQTSWVAGGGIFLASSATVTNNIISNNVLSGPMPQGSDLRGAGVYVSRGQPVISRNTISGNQAIPPAGSSGSLTYGYGGGLWLGFLSAPQVGGNLIENNWAGADPNVPFSIGSGGGIVVWTPGGTASPVVNGNLLRNNVSDSQGGGISLLSRSGTSAEAVVTNNIIIGNRSNFGGGVYTYFNKSSIVNNTISANTGFLGGGVYSGQSEPGLPIVITNNIIEGNLLSQPVGGSGGGIYTLDLSASFDPVISHNDLWNNQASNCGGERNDASCIGVSGNFSLNPRFVDRVAGDYRLDPNSPAIDRATAPPAPPADADQRPRGVDGDGVPNSPMPGDVDVGAYEFSGCLSSIEVCDGQDNNCNNFVDEGFPDTDGDGLADCVDPDDDDDLAPDASDCAPLDATAFAFPQAVGNLSVAGVIPTTISFDVQSAGSGTTYEIISGLVSRLWVAGLQEGFCARSALGSSPWTDTRPVPRAGDGWFYLARAVNACGNGTFGSTARDAPGAGDVCPAGVVDLDFDGSPSDLDCNDADALVSPIQAEVCDGRDNDCDQIVDEGNPGGGATCGVSGVGECRLGTTACVSGGIVCQGAVGPGPEFCDGKDNDCDGTPDNNVVDSDSDGLDDCADPDDDNDQVLDGDDCAPRDPSAFAAPTPIQGVTVTGASPTTIGWTDQALGSGTVYDVATGTLSVTGTVAFPSGTCLASVTGTPAIDPRAAPAEGSAHYYLVRARNACAAGTFGTAGRDAHPACP